MITDPGLDLVLRGSRVSRMRVYGTDQEGTVFVCREGSDAQPCDVLVNGSVQPTFVEDDTVLVWNSGVEGERGVIVGRIASQPTSSTRGQEITQDTPPCLIIEAKKNLTLRCGEGSITIREDGKILIKGKDLVSHAQRMNRIKGGSVSIN